jgi:hypothetical protein
MKRLLAAASLTAVALAISLNPAAAKSKKHHYRAYSSYAEPYAYGGWATRNVSDPSFGNRAGLNYARRTGRCVVDLGYGRFEYCGW